MVLRASIRLSRFFPPTLRSMSSTSNNPIHFGPFEVTDEVFYNTPLCYALVNIKPVLPGHVLVIPYRNVPRLTDLTAAELTDLFSTVQKVEKMLAKKYFPSSPNALQNGSFNVAIQDGPESGQTVTHFHCHVIPRTTESAAEGDGFYSRLQGEEGNVGGGLWDFGRPKAAGKFPEIEESERKPRGKEEMAREAEEYRRLMVEVDREGS